VKVAWKSILPDLEGEGGERRNERWKERGAGKREEAGGERRNERRKERGGGRVREGKGETREGRREEHGGGRRQEGGDKGLSAIHPPFLFIDLAGGVSERRLEVHGPRG
jgi:hypothetical protein